MNENRNGTKFRVLPPGVVEKNGTGFTLIETLIYTAFFALLVGSLLAITFQTLSSSGQVARKIAVQQEANFILRKIDWALGNMSVATVSASGGVLSGNGLVFNSGSGRVYLNGEFLNSVNVSVANLAFVQSGTNPKKITAGFDIGSEHFELNRFLKY